MASETTFPSPQSEDTPVLSPLNQEPLPVAENPLTSSSELAANDAEFPLDLVCSELEQASPLCETAPYPDADVPLPISYSEPQRLIDLRASVQSGLEAIQQESPNSLDSMEPIHIRDFPNPPPSKHSPLPTTIPNVKFMLDTYGIKVRYNVIKKKLMIRLLEKGGLVDNADNTAMTTILSLATLNGLQTPPIPAIVEVLADRNPYNPVATWILDKPWDGKDRLALVYGTITVREGFPESLKRTLVRKWLLSAVAAALIKNGFKGRGVLVFQGPQGIGKTSWLVSLVPHAKLRELVIKVDHHLDANNKDSILGAIAHWLVEIGELDSSFRKDFARLKGLLTSDTDKVRRHYARTESEYARRTVFFATVNDENFLVDHTGNTRWWTLPVVAINFNHGIDMQQVFAQLAVEWANGQEWWLTKEEEVLLEQCNSDHRVSSVIRDLLMEMLDLSKKDAPGNPNMSTTELFEKMGISHPKNGDAKELTGILRELLGPSKKINGTQRWRIPLRKADSKFPGL
jgi:putative DNA primase/helicase